MTYLQVAHDFVLANYNDLIYETVGPETLTHRVDYSPSPYRVNVGHVTKIVGSILRASNVFRQSKTEDAFSE